MGGSLMNLTNTGPYCSCSTFTALRTWFTTAMILSAGSAARAAANASSAVGALPPSPTPSPALTISPSSSFPLGARAPLCSAATTAAVTPSSPPSKPSSCLESVCLQSLPTTLRMEAAASWVEKVRNRARARSRSSSVPGSARGKLSSSRAKNPSKRSTISCQTSSFACSSVRETRPESSSWLIVHTAFSTPVMCSKLGSSSTTSCRR
mmetsp:Transcript_105/g.372  ORF Transcript_105/g.372 Transcript_105/m.372 type:complete len:208 (+) Transcript_105:166-789(+)